MSNQPPSAPAENDPHAVYAARLGSRRASQARSAALHRRIARGRLATFLLGVLIAWLALDRGALSPGWILLPVAVFAALVWLHTRVGDALERARRGVAFYERGIARLEDRWAGAGDGGDALQPTDHPYAEDLDLFGHGSLFQLLSLARTRSGERTLAAWLCAPARPEDVRTRQGAVAELRPRLDLREELSLLGADLRTAINPDRLVAWGAGAPSLLAPWIPVLAAVLSIVTIATIAGAAFRAIGLAPVLLAALLQAGLLVLLRQRIAHALAGVDRAGSELELLGALLARLERESVASPHLVRLHATLEQGGIAASVLIRRLERRIDLLDSGRNLLFMPVALLVSWQLHCACAIDRWRHRFGGRIAVWLDAVGEIEALSAFAGYAYENPGDPFPDVVDEGPLFEADAIAHPLLPRARAVRNDLRLSAEPQALVVSGSNMSGKSTLLRAVGINAVLALAGAPARARRLRLSPVAVGASIRIHDSLLEGSSRFQAEITRLRKLLDIARGPVPLLFLLDEVLHGTNSHDRRIGADAVVQSLLARGAIGLVTTHDLALAEIADRMAPRVANVHFEDHLEDGVIRFDYRMRPGVVRRSNALALMRAVGLEV